MPGIDITCPYCSQHFRIASSQVRQQTFLAKCGNCAGVFSLDGKMLLASLPPVKPTSKQINAPVFVCLENGEELQGEITNIQDNVIQISLSSPLSKEHLELLQHEKSSLRVGLHTMESIWEFFITLTCASLEVTKDLLQATIAIHPEKHYLVVEGHGAYLFVVRRGGAIEGGWKPLKLNKISDSTPIPPADHGKPPLILCGKVDPAMGRMQFKSYSLTDLLTIQHIAWDRHLVSQSEEDSLATSPTISPFTQPMRASSPVVGEKALPPEQETIFKSFNQAAISGTHEDDDAEWLTDVVSPPISPPPSPKETHSPPPENDITVKEDTKAQDEMAILRKLFPERYKPGDDDVTVKEDTTNKKGKSTDARASDARMRWIMGRIPGNNK